MYIFNILKYGIKIHLYLSLGSDLRKHNQKKLSWDFVNRLRKVHRSQRTMNDISWAAY